MVGPLFIGTIRDVADSFSPACYTFAAMAALLAVVPFFVSAPDDRDPEMPDGLDVDLAGVDPRSSPGSGLVVR